MITLTKAKVQITQYDGGENAVFASNGKSVSVVRTDYGLFDIKADNGEILYTGYDETQASEATYEYLQGW